MRDWDRGLAGNCEQFARLGDGACDSVAAKHCFVDECNLKIDDQ